MERTNSILVGAPRQGKTYFGERQLIEYAKNGGCSVVYNVGRPGDFSKFIPVEIFSLQDFKIQYERKNRKKMANYEIPTDVDYFIFEGKTYHLKHFSKMFKGKCVKIERCFNSGSYRTEDLFIKSIYKYFYNTLLMMDDCRTIFRKGLSSEMLGLLSRINHAGKHIAPSNNLIGIDIILTYHGFDTVNTETYQFVNLLCQFKTMYLPSLSIDNDELSEIIESNFHKLKSAPMYSHFEIDTMSGRNDFFKP